MRKHRTKVLALSVIAAIGVMATTAVSAEAGEFRIEKQTFTQRGISSETFVGTIGLTEFTVEWLGFGVDCAKGTLKGTMFKGGTINAEAKFQECFVPEFESVCGVESTGAGTGKITIQGPGEVVLHGGSYYAKFASENFTVLQMTGAECPLTEMPMTASGSAAIKMSSATAELVKQPFSAVTGKAEVKLLGVAVRCAGEPAAILGSGGTVELSGANAGKAWGLE